MNPLGDRARAEELARLLEGAVAGPGGSTAAYASLAGRLRGIAPVLDDAFGPREEFRTALRQRLLAVAAVHDPAAAAPTRGGALEAATAWTRSWQAQRRIAATAGAMAAVVAMTGVGIASSRSLPGQPFYGVKRAVEGLQLDFADGDTARGTKHLEFAATRLREVRALVSGQSELAVGTPGVPLASGLAFGGSMASRITSALADFDSETRSGKVLLERAFRRTGRTEPLKVLATFSTQQEHQLTTLLPQLPDAASAAGHASLDLVTSVGTTAEQLLAIGSCTASCNPSGAGPVLPPQPQPSPGTSASPGTADNGVAPCGCGAEPSPSPQPAAVEPTPQDTATPTATSSPSPTPAPPAPSPSPSPTSLLPLPVPLPTILPTGIPTTLPTGLPLPLPTLSPLLPGLVAVKP